MVPPRQCTDCHVNNNYALNSTLCYSCHQKDYAGTNNPPHASAGFPTTCELCHDTTVWTDSTFNHNNTTFPLTGIAPGAAASVHRLSRQQQLHDSADGVRRLPSDGLQQHDKSWPQGATAVLPNDMPKLPQHNGLDWSYVQSHAIHAISDESWQCE